MTAYLLNESQDLESFYSAEGELQNYLQTKIKKIHNTGKYLKKETKKKVKELLDLNSELINKLERISEKENRNWDLKQKIREKNIPPNQFLSQNFKERADLLENENKTFMRTATSESIPEDNLKTFLMHSIKENLMGIQSIISKLEKAFAQLVSIFVLFPKIIKNIQGQFEEKKEKSQYFPTKKKRKSRGLVFWKTPYNRKTSFSYIQNIFQKLLGSFSNALLTARTVIFKEDQVEGLEMDSIYKSEKKNSKRRPTVSVSK